MVFLLSGLSVGPGAYSQPGTPSCLPTSSCGVVAVVCGVPPPAMQPVLSAYSAREGNLFSCSYSVW